MQLAWVGHNQPSNGLDMRSLVLLALLLTIPVCARPLPETKLGPIDLAQFQSWSSFRKTHGRGLKPSSSPHPFACYVGLGLTCELWLTTGGGTAVTLRLADGKIAPDSTPREQGLLEGARRGQLNAATVYGLEGWRTGAGIGLGDSQTKVLACYGQPNRVKNGLWEYISGIHRASFTIKDRCVTEISLQTRSSLH